MRTVREDPRLPFSLNDPSARLALFEVLREYAASINEAANQRLWLFVSVSAAYSAGVNDHVILVAPSAPLTITLPAASDMRNKRVVVKRSNNTTHTITIDTTAGNIDGGASTSLTTAYQSREFFSDGSQYWLV